MPDDYAIGYRKPPRHSQFEKGQSGNPRGRSKGSKNLRMDLEEELQERIVVREGEVRKTVSKQRAMLKSQTAKAIRGDTRAAGLVVDMVYRLLHGGDLESSEEGLDDQDLAILETYTRRLRHPGPPSTDPPSNQVQPSHSADGEAGDDDR